MKQNKAGAIFHFHCRVHSRSDGANAVRIAAYVSGTRMKSEVTGRTYNYSKKTEVTHTEIMLPSSAKADFADRSTLANAIDHMESRRKDSQVCREIEVALPLLLTHDQQIFVLRRWINKNFVSRGMCVDFALHSKPNNPHSHLVLSLREVTADGFGKKVREWNNPRLVNEWRESWAAHLNAALEAAGFDIRVDHRSYKQQGLNIKPTRHLGKRYSDNKEAYEERLEHNADVISNRASAPLPSSSPAIAPGRCPATKKNKQTKNLTPDPACDQVISVTNDTPSI